MAEDKESATPKKRAVVTPTANGVAQMTLPEFLGYAMQRAMEDRRRMPEVQREFQMWYDAQPWEDRRDRAREIRKELEVAQSIPAALFSFYQHIALRDLT